MELTLGSLQDLNDAVSRVFPDSCAADIPLVVNRYNAQMTLDRIIIHVNGKSEVEMVFVDQPKKEAKP